MTTPLPGASSAPPAAHYVDDLTVSLGGALPDKSFKRVVVGGGAAGSADVSCAGRSVSLWATQVEAVGAERAVLDVAVLYDDEPVPEGFRRVARDLSAGVGARRSFLAFRTAPLAADARPVASLQLLAPGDVAGALRARARACARACRRPPQFAHPPTLPARSPPTPPRPIPYGGRRRLRGA